MAFKITDECISCGFCEEECPSMAISEGDGCYVIDPTKCTECLGSWPTQQCNDVCPVEAPILDLSYVETRDQLLAKFYRLHPGMKPVD
jgi:ferredoxin